MIFGDDARLANARLWMVKGTLRQRLPQTTDDPVFCTLCGTNLGHNRRVGSTAGYELIPPDFEAIGEDSLDVIEWLMSLEDSRGIKLSDEELDPHCTPEPSFLCDGCADDFAATFDWRPSM